MPALAEFASKFRLAELTVKSYRHWVWSLRPVQSTLSAGVLSISREATQFAGLTPEEYLGLGEAVKEVEASLKRAFAYDKINYLMLMMVDPLVHFHVLPRYQAPRAFLGEEWVDKNWGKFPDLGGPEITPDLAKALFEKLR
jgi:diadenosine tetraphosphate (Ap4A) HIT family hydrolase